MQLYTLTGFYVSNYRSDLEILYLLTLLQRDNDSIHVKDNSAHNYSISNIFCHVWCDTHTRFTVYLCLTTGCFIIFKSDYLSLGGNVTTAQTLAVRTKHACGVWRGCM